MPKFLKAALAATLGLFVVSGAYATGYQCAPTPKSEWKPQEQILKSLTGQGYEVRKIKVENDCYEAYATSGGKRFEIFVQPDTGQIAQIWED